MGDVTLIFSNNSLLVLKYCLYVPESKKNLILVSCLCKLNYSFLFNNKQVFIKLNNSFICLRSLIDSLYVIPLYALPSNENYHISQQRKEPNTNQTQLCHLNLGHINLYRIQRLVKSGILPSLILKDLPVCESCIEGKITKRPFTTKGYRVKECLELVHTDVCGPFNVHARGGYEYSLRLWRITPGLDMFT